jgi:hypothetical protein
MMPGPAGSSASLQPEAAPAANAGAATVTAATSENWSGYVSSGAVGAFTQVSAAWAEPTATCGSSETFSSFWVGLDGAGSSTVEQTGTEADCANGAATYQGWFEMFPNAPVFYDNPVQPGDAMSASVVAGGGGSFTLTLTDSTEGWTKVTQQTSDTAQLGSAEIIAEAPSSGSVLPLTNFGTVNFTDALIDNDEIGNLDTFALTMESAANVAEATPSAVTDGDDFTVTFDNTGTTAGTGGGGVGTGGGGTGPGGSGGGQGHKHRHHHYYAVGG